MKRIVLVLLLLAPIPVSAQFIIIPPTSGSGGNPADPYINFDGTSVNIGNSTLPLFNVPITTTVNNKNILFDLDETDTNTFQRFTIGPQGTTSYNLFYNNGPSGTYREMKIGQQRTGDFWSIQSTDVDSDRVFCTKTANILRYCLNANNSRPEADKSYSIGQTALGLLNVYSYKFIASNTSPPGIAGNATLNSGSADSAGKITATASAGSTAVITFGTSFVAAPACSVNNETTAPAAVANIMYVTSTLTTLTFHGTYTSGDVIAYHCIGY